VRFSWSDAAAGRVGPMDLKRVALNERQSFDLRACGAAGWRIRSMSNSGQHTSERIVKIKGADARPTVTYPFPTGKSIAHPKRLAHRAMSAPSPRR